MASTIFFRMHHGKQAEQVNFDGASLRLIELKKAIVDKKSMAGSLDFDLKITDENDADKVYGEDDEMVPKNSSVVVRRVPAKNSATSLISRINNLSSGISHNRAYQNNIINNSDSNRSNDIVINVKPDDHFQNIKPLPLPAPVPAPTLTRQISEVATSAVLADDEAEALKALSSGDSRGDNRSGDSNQAKQPLRRAAFIPPPQPTAGSIRVPQGYTCHRCGQTGHYIKFCPTNGDPTFDPVNRLLNVPMASRKKFTNLEGIDTANKTVIQNADGSFEVFEPSRAGREKMTRESEFSTNVEIAEATAPDHLKCPLSKTLLREAVVLPCCKQCVNDTAIRQELLASGLRCPLCSTDNVSPDSLIVQREVRNMVESFIAGAVKKVVISEAKETVAEEEPLNDVEASIKSQFEGFQRPTGVQQSPQLQANSVIPHDIKPIIHNYDLPPQGIGEGGPGYLPQYFPNNPGNFPIPNNGNMNMPFNGPGLGFPGHGPMDVGMPGPMMGGMPGPMGMGPMGPMIPPFGMWRSAAEIPRELLFPPLPEEEFYKERLLQVNESKRFEERRRQHAIENQQRNAERRARRSLSKDRKSKEGESLRRNRSRSKSADRRDKRENRDADRPRDHRTEDKLRDKDSRDRNDTRDKRKLSRSRSADRREKEKPKTEEKGREKDRDSRDRRETDKLKDKDRDSRDRRDAEKPKDRDADRGRDKERAKEKDRERDSRDRKDADRLKDREKERGRDKDRDSRDRRVTDKPRDKDREVDRDKNREKDRRDKERDSDSNRDREKDKNKERDREKDRQREKERDRVREKEREKDRTKMDSDARDKDRSKRSRDEESRKEERRDKYTAPDKTDSGRWEGDRDSNPLKRQKNDRDKSSEKRTRSKSPGANRKRDVDVVYQDSLPTPAPAKPSSGRIVVAIEERRRR